MEEEGEEEEVVMVCRVRGGVEVGGGEDLNIESDLILES